MDVTTPSADRQPDNTYTSRGSGTSYATPSVSGILALMMEINPDLDPLVLREILRTTSEVRGEPSAPDVHPHWNRDFGWGMVDARVAVEMAIISGPKVWSSTSTRRASRTCPSAARN